MKCCCWLMRGKRKKYIFVLIEEHQLSQVNKRDNSSGIKGIFESSETTSIDLRFLMRINNKSTLN